MAQHVLAAHKEGAAESCAYSAMVREAPARCRELDVTLRLTLLLNIDGTATMLTSSLTGACQENQAAPVPHEADAYFSGEKLAETRILLYWLTIIACALGLNA